MSNTRLRAATDNPPARHTSTASRHATDTTRHTIKDVRTPQDPPPLPPIAAAHLDAELARLQRDGRAPSVTAAVLRRGTVAWQGAAGHLDGHATGPLATPETQYRIGSITKSVAAVATMQLVRDGLVSLDDPIRRHLPELDPDLDSVRVADLLSHAGGLYAETVGPWWERTEGVGWQELLPSIRRAHRPGHRFHYSNVGFAVVGELVARQRHTTWFEWVDEHVLRPLGMTRTTYLPTFTAAPGLAVHPFADLVHDEPTHDARAMAPAGQLWSTVGDLARWGAFLVGGDDDMLPAALKAEMRVPALVDDLPGRPWTRAYGLGLDILNLDGRRFVGHGGSMPGFLAVLRVDPATGDGYTLLTNTTGNFDTDGHDLLDILDTHAPRVQDAWVVDPAVARDADLTGTWFWGPRRYDLTTGPDGELRLSPLSGGRGSRFVPLGTDRWVGTDEYYAGEELRVHARGERSAYLDLGSFRLTRTPYDPDADIPGGVDPTGWH